jgi:ribosome maturation factor RimP
MAKNSGLETRARASAEGLAVRLGFLFVDMELVKTREGRYLRFYLDKPGGISLSDLESYHRKVQPMIDNMDIIEYDYLEVSSPGADRPLKSPEDFDRAVGQQVEIKLYRPDDGRKRAFGTLIGLREGCVVIDDKGIERSIDLKSIAKIARAIEVNGD